MENLISLEILGDAASNKGDKTQLLLTYGKKTLKFKIYQLYSRLFDLSVLNTLGS